MYKDLPAPEGIYFVASARDYHAMDWYRLVRSLLPGVKINVLSDLVEGEGVKSLLMKDDIVHVMLPLDKLLLRSQSKIANIWRNFVKLAACPIMAWRINRVSSQSHGAIFHAHSMYYIFLCWLARVGYIATPMGSDVLVRTDESVVYKFFACKALRYSMSITVDSEALRLKIFELCGVDSKIIQNGIDTAGTKFARERVNSRSKIISIRGMDPNYRVKEILSARENLREHVSLDFLYPFHEINYLNSSRVQFKLGDIDHGRISKTEMYRLFAMASLCISIPLSDSSPRTVYEAIFCGAIVAVTYSLWIDALPFSMRSRILIVDIKDENWLNDVIDRADKLCKKQFIPCEEAIQNYDEVISMQLLCKNIYGIRNE